MASAKEVILGQLQMSGWLLEQMTADLSDSEFFKPAVPGSNHIAWIVGHIAYSEDGLTAKITGQAPAFGEKFAGTFGGQSKCVPDASKYPPVSEIKSMFLTARGRAIEGLKMFDEKRWNDPSPEGMPREYFPTMGSVWQLQGTHAYWHIGQLTTCRVAMGKKRVLE
ncbi:MAG: DinB family protein [Phycisphaerae bacterium]|nr:DinB family protein [Phycisphaerae bacterium]